MIGYVTIGADDISRAKTFYSAFLPALGYEVSETVEGLAYALPRSKDLPLALPEVYITMPFDGKGATSGNGMMVAFKARSQQEVQHLHAAALAAGGTNEGKPGFRKIYSPEFFVGYVRDPQGNKVAIYSSNPDDPSRDD
ncbi:MAG: VOC family protein [Pseudomonadota bacterium]